jgi:hypothetical protein
MWQKFKDVNTTYNGKHTVNIPAKYLSSAELERQSPFTEKYGSPIDEPSTPATSTIPVTYGPATEGTERTANLHNSHSSNQGVPTTDREVVTFDISQLSRKGTLHHNDIHKVYRELMIAVFRSNDKRLSRRFIDNLLDQKVNEENRKDIQQLWRVDCNWAIDEGEVENYITSHAQHPELNGAEIQMFAHLMQTYAPPPKDKIGRLTTNDLKNRKVVAEFGRKCDQGNVTMLLRDTFLIEPSAMRILQQLCRDLCVELTICPVG